MLNMELILISGEHKYISYVSADKVTVENIIQSSVNFVDSMDTEDMEASAGMINTETDVNAVTVIEADLADIIDSSKPGLFEWAINNTTWLDIGAEEAVPAKFTDDLVDRWSIEIDLNDEFARYYNFGNFAGAIDFLELDDMDNEAVHKKISEILTNGVAVSKLTVSTCRSVQWDMKHQKDVLEKLFECINEGREHPRFLEGVTDEEVTFAEQYCRDMINAANTLSTIAKNAEKILAPLEKGRSKAVRTTSKTAKKRTPRKKKETKKDNKKGEVTANGAA